MSDQNVAVAAIDAAIAQLQAVKLALLTAAQALPEPVSGECQHRNTFAIATMGQEDETRFCHDCGEQVA